jgi:hypothetical protein
MSLTLRAEALVANTMHAAMAECVSDKVHFYVSNEDYSHDGPDRRNQTIYPNYVGSITVESEYTL